jgi:hypothetical protein
MHLNLAKTVSRAFALAVLVALPVGLAAQAPDAPKPAKTAFPEDSPSRVDVFVGYSYLAPHGTVQVVQADGSVLPETYQSDNYGAIVSAAYFANKYVGVQVEASTHNTWTSASNNGITTEGAGLIFRYPTNSITPFIHALVNADNISGPDNEPSKLGVGVSAGGGLDYATPWHHISIRLFQADYMYMHADWGPGVYGGRANINAPRLSAGVVFGIGNIAPPPQLTVACAVNPTSVFPGDPVTATATVGMQDPKLNVIVSITGDGVSGTGATASINTSTLSPGTHTVKCDAKEGKPGKEGLKPWEVATESTASFTVKEFEPPTISCSANPTTLKPGDSSTVSVTAMSPQNRPLTYTYSASAGTINGSGTSATFSSTGAPTGPVSITCNVADDKGHNASGNTGVTIEAPPPPPQPHTQTLCSIGFTTDAKRPTRVDNEAKACLDEVALDLQKQSDAKAVVVGELDAKEKAKQEKEEMFAAKHKKAKVENFAAQRAVNAKEYLVTDKGIDPSRISVAVGTGDDQKVENYLVPAGATFSSDITGTTTVDETMVKPEVRKPLGEKPHHKHKAAM